MLPGCLQFGLELFQLLGTGLGRGQLFLRSCQCVALLLQRRLQLVDFLGRSPGCLQLGAQGGLFFLQGGELFIQVCQFVLLFLESCAQLLLFCLQLGKLGLQLGKLGDLVFGLGQGCGFLLQFGLHGFQLRDRLAGAFQTGCQFGLFLAGSVQGGGQFADLAFPVSQGGGEFVHLLLQGLPGPGCLG